MIEVEEFIRTESGHIGQVIEFDKSIECYTVKDGKNEYWIEPIFIVNHSKNIIDLIEEGDYVNGKKVISVLDGFTEGTMEIELSNHRKIYRTLPANIKTILTKELFEANCYKVEEKI